MHFKNIWQYSDPIGVLGVPATIGIRIIVLSQYAVANGTRRSNKAAQFNFQGIESPVVYTSRGHLYPSRSF